MRYLLGIFAGIVMLIGGIVAGRAGYKWIAYSEDHPVSYSTTDRVTREAQSAAFNDGLTSGLTVIGVGVLIAGFTGLYSNVEDILKRLRQIRPDNANGT